MTRLQSPSTIRGLPDAEPNDERSPIRGSPHAKVEPMGGDNTSEMTGGRDSGEDSKKGVRSSSANADADPFALISGVVGTVRSTQDTESPTLTVLRRGIPHARNRPFLASHNDGSGHGNSSAFRLNTKLEIHNE